MMAKNKNNIQIGVVAVIVDDNNNIFIAQTPKLKNGWTIPGGHVEFSENLEAAIVREVFEETGLRIKVEKLINICESIDKKNGFHMVSFHFFCRLLSKKEKIILDKRELISSDWVNCKKALRLIFLPDFKKTIKLLLN